VDPDVEDGYPNQLVTETGSERDAVPTFRRGAQPKLETVKKLNAAGLLNSALSCWIMVTVR